MANIALNVNRLPIADKVVRGQEIITLSTNNPDVPGNAAALAEFSEAQEALIAANNAYESHREETKNLLDRRKDALAAWITALTGLAGVTENVTQGNPTKITSAGFSVRGEPTPPQPLPAPVNLLAQTNGRPGVTKLSWEAMNDVAVYIIQMSTDPLNEAGWEIVGSSTKSRCEISGAQPGKPVWYRVAAVNGAGQGPWSAPALRPVM